MNYVSWDITENLIDNMFNDIFKDYDLSILSTIEKRIIIYNYLIDNIEYDYSLLENRRNNKPVNNNQEVLNVLTIGTGICSSISQVYKLLLEKVNISSICFCCNDGTELYHQVVLVNDNNYYSFDDITGVIVGRGNKADFFGYDIEQAKILKQGNFIGMPSQLIDAIVRRKTHNYHEKIINETSFVKLPNNIKKTPYIDLNNKII
jgi:hypothetical protein